MATECFRAKSREPRDARLLHLCVEYKVFLTPTIGRNAILIQQEMPSHLSLTFIFISTLVLLAAILLNLASLSHFVWFSDASNTLTPYVSNPRNGVSYHGTVTNGIEHFQNIFYAEDTSGSNRFAPPVPYTPPPASIIDATTAGAWCPQGIGAAPLPFTSPITNVSENCLSLRIARSSGTDASAKLPVLAWLHGGTRSEDDRGMFVVADSMPRWQCNWECI